MDRADATALVAAIGQYLVDNAEAVAAYAEEIKKAVVGASPGATVPKVVAEDERGTPALPTLKVGDTVRVTIVVPSSSAPYYLMVKVESAEAYRVARGVMRYKLSDGNGLVVHIGHLDDMVWRMVDPVPSMYAACYRVEVAVEPPAAPASM
jgi:hypothetical protein